MSEEENIENNEEKSQQDSQQEDVQKSSVEFSPEEFKQGVERFEDLNLNLKVLLGRVKIPVGQLLRITRGSILELKTHKNSLLEVTVNEMPIGDCEIVLREEKIAVEMQNIFKRKKN